MNEWMTHERKPRNTKVIFNKYYCNNGMASCTWTVHADRTPTQRRRIIACVYVCVCLYFDRESFALEKSQQASSGKYRRVDCNTLAVLRNTQLVYKLSWCVHTAVFNVSCSFFASGFARFCLLISWTATLNIAVKEVRHQKKSHTHSRVYNMHPEEITIRQKNVYMSLYRSFFLSVSHPHTHSLSCVCSFALSLSVSGDYEAH